MSELGGDVRDPVTDPRDGGVEVRGTRLDDEGLDCECRREALRLHALKPALVLTNVPYLTLAAAALAGIPSAAVCSLNWAEIFYSYCRGKPYAELIYRQIHEAYSQASVFLTPKPSMPMSGFEASSAREMKMSSSSAPNRLSRCWSNRKSGPWPSSYCI